MLTWLSQVWQRINHWFNRRAGVPQVYHRSNLHGRHR